MRLAQPEEQHEPVVRGGLVERRHAGDAVAGDDEADDHDDVDEHRCPCRREEPLLRVEERGRHAHEAVEEDLRQEEERELRGDRAVVARVVAVASGGVHPDDQRRRRGGDDGEHRDERERGADDRVDRLAVLVGERPREDRHERRGEDAAEHELEDDVRRGVGEVVRRRTGGRRRRRRSRARSPTRAPGCRRNPVTRDVAVPRATVTLSRRSRDRAAGSGTGRIGRARSALGGRLVAGTLSSDGRSRLDHRARPPRHARGVTAARAGRAPTPRTPRCSPAPICSSPRRARSSTRTRVTSDGPRPPGRRRTQIDRLRLDHAKLEGMAGGLRQVATLPDPVGEVTEGWVRPNGLRITKVRVPLGVVAIIYENRPNVTSDAAALCLKSGNVAFLRGSSGAIESNKAIAAVLRDAAVKAGLPADAVVLVEDTRHEAAVEFMQLRESIDVLIPRGGPSLIRSILENATVPYVIDGDGNCHVYVDASADLDDGARHHRQRQDAAAVGVQRRREPGRARRGRPTRSSRMVDAALGRRRARGRRGRAGAHPRMAAGDRRRLRHRVPRPEAVGQGRRLDRRRHRAHAALRHRPQRGHRHERHRARPTGSCARSTPPRCVVNASTRFVDGGEFGLGAEIGISTQKLHARGPMGLRELTTEKYVVRGDGPDRGSDTVISIQPSTCEVSASRTASPRSARPGEVVALIDQTAGQRRRPRPPATCRTAAFRATQVHAPLALDEQERGVGEPGGDAEQHAARRVGAVRAALQRAGDEQHARTPGQREQDAARHLLAEHRQREERDDHDLQVAEHGRQPGADVADRVVPGEMSSANSTPAANASHRSRRCAARSAGAPTMRARPSTAARRRSARPRRGGRDVGEVDEDRGERDHQRAEHAGQRPAGPLTRRCTRCRRGGSRARRRRGRCPRCRPTGTRSAPCASASSTSAPVTAPPRP